MTGVKRFRDLYAWQLAEAFKSEVFRLVESSPGAQRHFKFRSQLVESAAAVSKHISEGFLRFLPADNCNFLRYAISSLGEAEGWVRDGIELGYFKEADCALAFRFCRRCAKATSNYRKSIEPFIEESRRRQSRRRKPRRPPPDSDQPPDGLE